MSDNKYTETKLWEQGENNISLFHVFGLTSYKNFVFCFAEARYNSAGDADCPHDLVMRISRDYGETFEPTVCLVSGEKSKSLANPVPLIDQSTGKLFLFYSDNIKNLCTDNYLIESTDFGLNWSAPQKINYLLENVPNSKSFHLAGPGHGIMLRCGDAAGRLIVPFWHRFGVDRPEDKRGYCISALYSDNHGVSWKQTDFIGFDRFANESRIVETKNGLLWIFRSGSKNTARCECRSTDGGLTWSDMDFQHLPPANNCDAGANSLPEYSQNHDIVLVSSVSSVTERKNMALYLSFDEGNSFSEHLRLPDGDATPGYSDICILRENELLIGLLHCRNKQVLFSQIYLK